MSQEIFLRGLGSCLFSLFIVWIVFSRHHREMGSGSTETGGQKYQPYIPGSLLPLVLLTLLVLATAFYGFAGAAKSVLSSCFGIFLHICAYYFVLLLVIPVFRMRYRLKTITKPVKRRSGALTVGLVFFLLCMTSGYVSLAYGGGTGAEIIYQSGDYSGYHLRSVSSVSRDDYGNVNYSTARDDYSFAYDVTDEAAFHEYLAGLTLSEFTGNYSFSESSREFVYIMDTPDGVLGIDLYDNYMRLTYFGEKMEQTGYYITEGVDWGYLGTVIVERKSDI